MTLAASLCLASAAFGLGAYGQSASADEIPLPAQIVAIVDVYDALTTARAYKPALSKDQAYEELRAEVRRGWRRADLVEAFITANLG